MKKIHCKRAILESCFMLNTHKTVVTVVSMVTVVSGSITGGALRQTSAIALR